MTTIDGRAWYRPTEYANMYGKTRQDVNGLMIRGSIATRTIRGKTHVSGTPPWTWKRIDPAEIAVSKVMDKPPYCYMDMDEEPHPEKSPFPGAWTIARRFDISWREVVFEGEKLNNDPAKVNAFFLILDAWNESTLDAEEHATKYGQRKFKATEPPEILIDYHFRERLRNLLNNGKLKVQP